MFIFRTTVFKSVSLPTKSPSQFIPITLFPEAKLPEREADYSSLSCVEFNNIRSFTSMPPEYVTAYFLDTEINCDFNLVFALENTHLVSSEM
jgi:hypothetical protein